MRSFRAAALLAGLVLCSCAAVPESSSVQESSAVNETEPETEAETEPDTQEETISPAEAAREKQHEAILQKAEETAGYYREIGIDIPDIEPVCIMTKTAKSGSQWSYDTSHEYALLDRYDRRIGAIHDSGAVTFTQVYDYDEDGNVVTAYYLTTGTAYVINYEYEDGALRSAVFDLVSPGSGEEPYRYCTQVYDEHGQCVRSEVNTEKYIMPDLVGSTWDIEYSEDGDPLVIREYIEDKLMCETVQEYNGSGQLSNKHVEYYGGTHDGERYYTSYDEEYTYLSGGFAEGLLRQTKHISEFGEVDYYEYSYDTPTRLRSEKYSRQDDILNDLSWYYMADYQYEEISAG
ncbi:MAG: hypothetical protein IJ737_01380 [Ruminococcus sp.]|nr:hypothetical protein [Ruminococcus sp.]MBR2282953.1 hypothetical protein [Ruminococcus sp.]